MRFRIGRARIVRSGGAAVVVALVAACTPMRPGHEGKPVPMASAQVGPAAPSAVPTAAAAGATTARATPSAAATIVAPTDSTALARAMTRDSAARVVRRDSVPLLPSPTDIAKEASQVFGAAKPSATDTMAAVAAGGAVWDIDVKSYETRSRVAYFVQIFSGRARGEFERSLQRQTRYGALISQRLRDGGLPEDMTYLALIESWYNPHAYSKAAAVGMWQFMAGTARGVGLRVDWWVDDRRDPVRSTEGAVRYLKALRNQFGGSVYLAAAAYDGGDGRVSRGLARYAGDLNGVVGDDRYFTLADTKYLRKETRDYVPKLIAAALVGKEPARYNVHVDTVAPFVYDSVRVPPATPLAAVGNATGNALAAMKEFNTHLLRGMTPPGDSTWVRVTAGTSTKFAEKFSALEPDERAGGVRVESKKGESMSSIARKHGISAKQLAWYNPKVSRLKNGNLVAGQRIFVPTKATVSAAIEVPNPSIEKYPRRAKVGKKHVAKKHVTKKHSVKKATGKKGAVRK